MLNGQYNFIICTQKIGAVAPINYENGSFSYYFGGRSDNHSENVTIGAVNFIIFLSHQIILNVVAAKRAARVTEDDMRWKKIPIKFWSTNPTDLLQSALWGP